MASRATAQKDFTFVIFPDTQYMVEFEAITDVVPMWTSMCQWVVKNRKAQNIQAVLSVGDVTDDAVSAQFEVASEGFRLMETAGIPCVPIVGNHEYDLARGMVGGSGARDRRVTGFDSVFGPSRFEGKSYYGGSLNGSHANYYITLSVGKSKFLIVALEFFPRQEAVAWASRVIDAYPDAETIILTHAYLHSDGTRIGKYGPEGYGLNDDCSGEDLWDRLIRRKPNILAVVSGHIGAAPHATYRSDTGDGGNTVHAIKVNYQRSNWGDGWVGLLKFRPSLGTIEMSSYRTWAPSGLGYDPDAPMYSLPWPRDSLSLVAGKQAADDH
jgi:hypothetical protein